MPYNPFSQFSIQEEIMTVNGKGIKGRRDFPFSCSSEHDKSWIFIDVDDARRLSVLRFQNLFEKTTCSLGISFDPKQKVKSVVLFIKGLVKIGPFVIDLNLSLVNTT